jgi:NAD(P)-dependent dehydrogenase (short-subunit alcohol dehydrogenase family)
LVKKITKKLRLLHGDENMQLKPQLNYSFVCTALWGVVNNAGIVGSVAPFEWLTMEDLTEPFQTNTVGMIRVIQTFLPLLKRSTQGARLVNVASILGRVTIPFGAPYAMSKHAIVALSDALRYAYYMVHYYTRF